METIEKKDLSKKWTWILYLAANVLLVLGVAIAWIMFHEWGENSGFSQSLIYIPTGVCGALSVIVMFAFYFFETKELAFIQHHVNVKWFKFYLWSGYVFGFLVLFTTILTVATLSWIEPDFRNIAFIINFSLTCVFSLVNIGLYRYGRFKIDLDLYRRWHGEQLKKQKELDEKKQKHLQIDSKKYKKELDKQKTVMASIKNETASAGLLNQVEHEKTKQSK